MFAGDAPINVNGLPCGRVAGCDVEARELELAGLPVHAVPPWDSLFLHRVVAGEARVQGGAPVPHVVMAGIAGAANLAFLGVPPLGVKGGAADRAVGAPVLAGGAIGADRAAEAHFQCS